MKTTFMMTQRGFENLKQAIDEMGTDVFSVFIDAVQKDVHYPDILWVSLGYKSVNDLFYLGCYVGRIEMTIK